MTPTQRVLLDRLAAAVGKPRTLTCWGASLRTAQILESHGFLREVPLLGDRHRYKGGGEARAFIITERGQKASGWRR